MNKKNTENTIKLNNSIVDDIIENDSNDITGVNIWNDEKHIYVEFTVSR